MLVLLCGLPLAGKATVAACLAAAHVGIRDSTAPPFQVLRLGASANKVYSDNDDDDADADADDNLPRPAVVKCFTRSDELEDFVMSDGRWQANWAVIVDPTMPASCLASLRKRPFVLLVAVVSPLSRRFSRLRGRRKPAASMPDFALLSDSCDFPAHDPSDGVAALTRCADYSILNSFHSFNDLASADWMGRIHNAAGLRPCWDSYFMKICHVAARRSNCMKRRVGCVLVLPDRRILNTGYNGTPFSLPNCCDGGCRRCNSNMRAGVGLDECLCLHAEENALLDAGRSARGATLYCTTFPCLGCAKKIAQAGITRVVYESLYYSSDNTMSSESVKDLFNKSSILLHQHTATDLPFLSSPQPDLN